MRPHEQHTLDLIAHDIAAHDPELARQLSTPTLESTPRSRRLDTWIRRATITAIWLLGVAFGATLLGFGFAEHEQVTAALGAAITAAILATGVLITYWHHYPHGNRLPLGRDRRPDPLRTPRPHRSWRRRSPQL